ncbi:MAG: hypothetical protein P4M11_10010 [Candidatus Pacebacteria bacterium]|nr:hypothetical protein [Candidatus Paceibacterota bacterium]
MNENYLRENLNQHKSEKLLDTFMFRAEKVALSSDRELVERGGKAAAGAGVPEEAQRVHRRGQAAETRGTVCHQTRN